MQHCSIRSTSLLSNLYQCRYVPGSLEKICVKGGPCRALYTNLVKAIWNSALLYKESPKALNAVSRKSEALDAFGHADDRD